MVNFDGDGNRHGDGDGNRYRNGDGTCKQDLNGRWLYKGSSLVHWNNSQLLSPNRGSHNLDEIDSIDFRDFTTSKQKKQEMLPPPPIIEPGTSDSLRLRLSYPRQGRIKNFP